MSKSINELSKEELLHVIAEMQEMLEPFNEKTTEDENKINELGTAAVEYISITRGIEWGELPEIEE